MKQANMPLTPNATDSEHVRVALAEHKQRGIELAVQVRWIAIPIIAMFLIAVNPTWPQLYYLIPLSIFCLNGWLLRRVARIGRSGGELALIMFDLLLLLFSTLMPNPFEPQVFPLPMAFEHGSFVYFFFLLSAATLAHSWKTVWAFGIWTSILWLGASVVIWLIAPETSQIGNAIADLVGRDTVLWSMLNPNDVHFELRIQEAMVFLIVSGVLALSSKRYYEMLLNNAGLERERTNLSRYFSPNVVEQLSHNDDLLKRERNQHVAVLFVDIIGFTELTQTKKPHEVIEFLRSFYARMEVEVFRHQGTLDKYLGDGLMVTFGTPFEGRHDATDALSCAIAMQDSMKDWNRERALMGCNLIKLGIGLHYGEVVLGDVGANQLEFAVIGTPVNVASRLERLTRELGSGIVMGDALYRQVRAENNSRNMLLGFCKRPDQVIRGIKDPMTVWSLCPNVA